MEGNLLSVVLNIIYVVLGVVSIFSIIMIAFLMKGKGNGLSAISNNNLSLFENIKSYGIEKNMQKVCAVLTFMMFATIITYLVIMKVWA